MNDYVVSSHVLDLLVAGILVILRVAIQETGAIYLVFSHTILKPFLVSLHMVLKPFICYCYTGY